MSDIIKAETSEQPIPESAMRDLVSFDGMLQVGIVILADVSGSMHGARIEALRRELGQLWAEIGDRAKLIAFSHNVIPISSPAELPAPHGGTRLENALREANKLHPSLIFVISDGEPNNRDQALEAAEESIAEINVLFVGSDGDDQSLDFMERLARVGGGKMRKKDIGRGGSMLEDMRDLMALPAPTAL